MKKPERHDILFLNEAGWREISEDVSEKDRAYGELLSRFPFLPVIDTGREEPSEKKRIVGISFPVVCGGVRKRILTKVRPEGISAVKDPREIPAEAVKDGRIRKVITAAKDLAAGFGVETGIYGSAAMEAVTGYPYLHEGSDIDFLFRNISAEALIPFADTLFRLEERYLVSADAEVKVPLLYRTEETIRKGFGYVKFRELVSSQATVIVRGCGEPVLYKKTEVIKYLQ